ncbi:hypothetical protein F5X98DRAFT_350749 [Xylaria grammica]|nr:hypothetical protein F5X98DRAFT_350749 [Xylaria grammica]
MGVWYMMYGMVMYVCMYVCVCVCVCVPKYGHLIRDTGMITTLYLPLLPTLLDRKVLSCVLLLSFVPLVLLPVLLPLSPTAPTSLRKNVRATPFLERRYQSAPSITKALVLR